MGACWQMDGAAESRAEMASNAVDRRMETGKLAEMSTIPPEKR
jgi:hypothetical protein